MEVIAKPNLAKFRVILREEAQSGKSKSFGIYSEEFTFDELFEKFKEYFSDLGEE